MTDPTQTPDDEFAAAFSELSTPGTPSSTPAAAAAPSGTESGAAVSPSASAPSGTEPAAAAAAPSGDSGNASGTSGAATPAAGAEASTPTAAQPAATPSAEAAPDLAAQFAALQAELAELKKAAPAATPAPTPAPAAATPPPLYDAEEQTAVENYMKEWPDVAKGEALLRRAEYQQMMQYIWNQFAPRIDALESSTQNVTTRTQYQDIVALVPDYDAVRDATLAWIDTQPEYLKAAYQQVASTGTPKDVADLITRFKRESGYVEQQPAGSGVAGGAAAAAGGSGSASLPAGGAAATKPAPAAAASGAAGLAPAVAAAAAALKPVKTARSEPVAAPDPNDFDAAFKEFATAAG